jgi:hypothetical protein
VSNQAMGNLNPQPAPFNKMRLNPVTVLPEEKLRERSNKKQPL